MSYQPYLGSEIRFVLEVADTAMISPPFVLEAVDKALFGPAAFGRP